jgi:hypothetical protein
MSEVPSQMPKRYKTGLDIPPHKVEQLRRTARRIPWLVGTVVGALCMPTYPGKTRQAGLILLAICVGGGLLVGLILDRLSRRWFLPKTRD